MPRPPFRADHVGSFLRPARLRDAREKFFAGALPAEDLRAIENSCIREVVKAQENVGLKGITDGEFRRTYFHVDFLEKLDGIETHYGEFSTAFRKSDGTAVGFKPPTMHVEGKIQHSTPIQGADFDFLKSVVTRTPKVCIPAPSMLHFRGGRDAISSRVYPRLEDFYDDLTAAYRAICSSTTRTSPISAIPRSASAPRPAATIRTRWSISIASSSTTRSAIARRT
jgi:5-methyltetrahydropteroyltriglutamate--homocysteine methyltransferase